MPKATLQGTILCHTFLLIALTSAIKICPLLPSSPGYTDPPNDIFLKRGEDLRITCHIDLARSGGYNASHLYFTRGDGKHHIFPAAAGAGTDGVGVLDDGAAIVTVLNETAAELYVRRPERSQWMYTCMLHDPYTNEESSVCVNLVVVDSAPRDPLDFRCVSQNWDNLTCELRHDRTYVNTSYNMSFYLPATRKKALNYCTKSERDESGLVERCVWDLSTQYIYRQQYEQYVFNITIGNRFGTRYVAHNFSHFEYVIPAQPSYLDTRDRTAHSVLVVWNVTRPMNNFKAGLHHRIQYVAEHENRTGLQGGNVWKVANTSSIPAEAKLQYRFDLTDLKYAYTRYDLRVQIKSAVAPDLDDRWSKYRTLTFRTSAERPSRPPRTVVGCFEVRNKKTTRDVLIFWETLEDHEKNGPDFGYVIDTTENGQQIVRSHDEIRSNYANFSDLSFDREYEFAIAANNSIGRSIGESLVRVPKQRDIAREPLQFMKISLTDYIYELSWLEPRDHSASTAAVRNYTLFWCQSERERPTICPSPLRWITLPATTRTHNVTVPTSKNYQFAIAANTDRSSSGMVWATCTVINKGVGRMRSVRITVVHATSAQVSWNLDCQDVNGVVVGFRVYYCVIENPQAGRCLGPRLDRNFTHDPTISQAVITELQPYTTYQVNVSVIMKNKEGLPSDPLLFTTLEAAPTKPLDLRLLSVTNTTISLDWRAPDRHNGHLVKYVVRYTSAPHNGTRTVETDQNCMVTLTELHGYTDYAVRVTAWTSLGSEPSDPLNVTTLIGYPSEMAVPLFNVNISRATWRPPARPGGPLDYYEIRFVRTAEDRRTEIVYNTTATSFVLPDATCEPDSKTIFKFSVRAVNIDRSSPATTFTPPPLLQRRTSNVETTLPQHDATNSDEQQPRAEHRTRVYAGEWSPTVENKCYGSRSENDVVLVWIGAIVGFLLFAGATIYVCKRVLDRIKDIKAIEVKLPDGLSIDKETKCPYDETTLLQPKIRKASICDERNTMNSAFTAKNSSGDSGMHNGSSPDGSDADRSVFGNKWSGSRLITNNAAALADNKMSALSCENEKQHAHAAATQAVAAETVKSHDKNPPHNANNNAGAAAVVNNVAVDNHHHPSCWPSDNIEGYTKLSSDNNYTGNNNPSKYCLVGDTMKNPATSAVSNNNKLSNGYVQAVLPMTALHGHNQNHQQQQQPAQTTTAATVAPSQQQQQRGVMAAEQPYDCTILKPLNSKPPPPAGASSNSADPGGKINNGYLPIASLTATGANKNQQLEQPTRLLLGPNTPEDEGGPDDEEQFLARLRAGVKKSEIAHGYVVVDADNSVNRRNNKIAATEVADNNNPAIPKGYVVVDATAPQRHNNKTATRNPAQYDNGVDLDEASLMEIAGVDRNAVPSKGYVTVNSLQPVNNNAKYTTDQQQSFMQIADNNVSKQNTPRGYVTVDALTAANTARTSDALLPRRPMMMSGPADNGVGSIPKGYVKTAEIIGNNTTDRNTTHAVGDTVTKLSNVSPLPPIAATTTTNGYVQHRLDQK